MKEAESRSKARSVVIFPIGSVEEHGDHLSIGLVVSGCVVLIVGFSLFIGFSPFEVVLGV
jgi:hypothetical protein